MAGDVIKRLHQVSQNLTIAIAVNIIAKVCSSESEKICQEEFSRLEMEDGVELFVPEPGCRRGNCPFISYVCRKTVHRMVDLFLKTGDVEAQGHKRGPKPPLLDVQLSGLLQTVFGCPAAYLDELQVKCRANYVVHACFSHTNRCNRSQDSCVVHNHEIK
jgi:hypothetical protein